MFYVDVGQPTIVRVVKDVNPLQAPVDFQRSGSRHPEPGPAQRPAPAWNEKRIGLTRSNHARQTGTPSPRKATSAPSRSHGIQSLNGLAPNTSTEWSTVPAAAKCAVAAMRVSPDWLSVEE